MPTINRMEKDTATFMNKDEAKKLRSFLALSILVVLGRAFDVTTTYLYTPDLKNETNVIVNLFGAGWLSVIVLQSALIGAIIYCLYFYFFRFKPQYPSDHNLDLKQFSSYLFFHNTTSFKKLFYQIPKDKNALIASTGYIASMTLIVVSFIVGTSTTLLLASDMYKEIYRNGMQIMLFVIIGVSAIWFAFRFLTTEYRKYQSLQHAEV